jgi:predicted nucleic acid-binding protein
LSRTINNADRAVAISREVQSLPNHRWVLLDFELANEAAEIGANHRLRGADAVYAAVARRHKATLVTLDRQQLERLPPLLEVRTPGEVLSTFQG